MSVEPTEPAAPAVAAIPPATAARSIRQFLRTVDLSPALAGWAREVAFALLADMLIHDMGDDAKEKFREYGIEIPNG